MPKKQNQLVQRGFTLLELLVVMVIIGLLVGYVGPKYFAQIGKSEVKAARSQIDALGRCISQRDCVAKHCTRKADRGSQIPLADQLDFTVGRDVNVD